MRWTIEDDGAGRHAKKAPTPEGKPDEENIVGNSDHPCPFGSCAEAAWRQSGFQYTDLPQGTRVEVDMPMLRMHG
jgi:hypothetical protein